MDSFQKGMDIINQCHKFEIMVVKSILKSKYVCIIKNSKYGTIDFMNRAINNYIEKYDDYPESMFVNYSTFQEVYINLIGSECSSAIDLVKIRDRMFKDIYYSMVKEFFGNKKEVTGLKYLYRGVRVWPVFKVTNHENEYIFVTSKEQVAPGCSRIYKC